MNKLATNTQAPNLTIQTNSQVGKMQQGQKAGKAANRGTNYEKQHVTAKRNKTKERVRKSLVL